MENYGTLPRQDIEAISQVFTAEFQELNSANIIVVGASGFLGRWISTSLTYMKLNDLFQGGLYLLVRDRAKISELEFLNTLPTGRIVPISSMDENTFSNLNGERTIVIYAASRTSNAGKSLQVNPESYLELPNRIINLLPKHGLMFVHLSSGAVYEPSSRLKSGILGTEKVQISSSDSYSAEKIILEHWLESKVEESRLIIRNPRLFAFYGPGLQLDRHFAVGEFMRNGKSKTPIIIKGNPNNLRSYLHPRDAVHQIFLNCKSVSPVNSQIGSRNVMSIETLAHVIAREFNVNVEVLNTNPDVIDNYVPLDVPQLTEKDFVLGISEWRHWLEAI
jgi:nucleoside-diphosphate-sugar epimerase